jgi:hypothetical protein
MHVDATRTHVKPAFQCVLAHSNPGFMASWLGFMASWLS